MKPTLDERLDRIADKLQKLAAADVKRELFGADVHQYRLNPCLSESEVAQFEAQHKIQLPSQYRAFLLRAGNGGAGPHYGLKPLEKSLDYLATSHGAAHPELPFPHTSRWYSLEEWEEIGKPEHLYAYYAAKEEELQHNYGQIVLSDEGCGMSNFLVVTGAERGSVWKDDLCNDGEIYPLRLDTVPTSRRLYDRSEDERISFFDWYEHWLNYSLVKFKNEEKDKWEE